MGTPRGRFALCALFETARTPAARALCWRQEEASMDGIGSAVTLVLGLDRGAHDLATGQVCARAIVVFLAGLAIMRVGNRRFLGKATPFDVMLGFVLGSVLSRAISGTAA